MYPCSFWLQVPQQHLSIILNHQARQPYQRTTHKDLQWAVNILDSIMEMLGERAKNSFLSTLFSNPNCEVSSLLILFTTLVGAILWVRIRLFP